MFDPYHKWLGIRDAQRPPNHYRLLGVELFEVDHDVIDSAADRQMAHVRQFQSGERAEVSQRVLNEIAQAKVCLLNPEKRGAYDKRLRSELARSLPTSAVTESLTAATTSSTPTESTATKDAPGATGSAMDPNRPVINALPESATDRVRRRSNWGVAVAGFLVFAALLAGLFLQPWKQKLAASSVSKQTEPDESDPPASTSVVDSTEQGDSSHALNAAQEHDSAPSGESSREDEYPANRDSSSQPEVAEEGGVPAESPVASTKAAPPWEVVESRMSPSPVDPKHPAAACLMGLRERDMGAARRQLKAITHRFSVDPTMRDAAERLGLVFQHIESFWKSVEKGLSNLQVGDSLTIRGVPCSVEDRRLDSLTVRCGGKEKTYSLEFDQIDSDVAVALAEVGLTSKGPARDWVIGTFWGLDQAGDIRLANECYERARAGGMPTDLLLTEACSQQSLEGTPGTFSSRQTSGDSTSAVSTQKTRATEAADGSSVEGKRKLITLDRCSVVPSSQDQEKSLRLIRKLYADQLKGRSPASRTKLAVTMIDQAKDTDDGSAGRFVLLSQASKLAVAAGDVEVAWQALDEMSADYEVDIDKLRSDAIVALGKRLDDMSSIRKLLDNGVSAVDSAIQKDNYKMAGQMARVLLALARKSSDTDLIRWVQAMPARVSETKSRFESLGSVFEKYQEEPSDPGVNRALGRFYCFQKGDFSRGLPMLAKGDDESLRGLATLELAGGDDPQSVRIADAWWEIAEDESKTHALMLKLHAARHYRDVVDRLAGLEKARIEQRIAEVNPGQSVGKWKRLMNREVLVSFPELDLPTRMVFRSDGTIEAVGGDGKRHEARWRTDRIKGMDVIIVDHMYSVHVYFPSEAGFDIERTNRDDGAKSRGAAVFRQ